MKILIINQYFPPDRAATAILLGQLAQHLAENHEVDVICGTPTYNPDFTQTSLAGKNLRIITVKIPPVQRASLISRAWAYLSFTLGALLKVFRLSGPYDVVLCWTDPPWIALAAIYSARKFKCRWVWTTQDIYPEIAYLSGVLKDAVAVTLFRKLMSWICTRVDHAVAIGSDMKTRLITKGIPASRISVICNWQNEALIQPKDKTVFRNKYKLPLGAFIIMHSGNLGTSQDFESLLECAQILKSQPDILFVIIGDGARKTWIVKQVEEKSLWNVKLLPYQEEMFLSESLSTADLHYVSLYPNLWGYIVPSKIYGVTAAKKPVLANLPSECSLYHEIAHGGFGVCCLAKGEALAETIMNLRKDPEVLMDMGARAGTWFETHGRKAIAMQKYEELLRSLGKTHA